MVRKLALALALSAPLLAQPVPLDQLVFERLPSRILRPVDLADPDDGTGRLFAVAQAGRIFALEPGRVTPRTMLAIEDKVSCCGEQGLLGLTLHPKFRENGLLFVNYTNRQGENGHSVLARYQISANDPNLIDPNSELVLMEVEQTTVGHNGGQVAFGADGYLYTSFGDGGLPSGFPDRAQDMSSLLGKILRIDVDRGEPYAIPPTNPLVDEPGARPEIYLSGLRNPWRFSFDRKTQGLFIADVGDGEWEEVSLQPGSSPGGENFGWSFFEGSRCWKNSSFCDPTGLIPPILEYPHADPNECYSVTGGYVYRGSAMPALQGSYIFGDFCTGQIWAATQSEGTWQLGEPLGTDWSISTFAEDADGELYVANYDGSEFFRITMPAPRPEISSAAPMILTAGATEATLLVQGAGFVPESIATLEGIDSRTELMNGGTLRVRVDSDAIAGPGPVRLAVRTGHALSGQVELMVVEGAQPTFPLEGVVNAASFVGGALAPGTIVSIFGDPVALGQEAATFLPLPLELGGASVVQNGSEPARLFSSVSGQINLVLSSSLEGDVVRLALRLGDRVREVTLPLAQYSPGVFTVDSTGAGQGAVTIAGSGGCLAGPPVRGKCGRPVRAGQIIEIFLTGLGRLVSANPGARLPRPTVTSDLPEVTIGGTPAQVLCSGAAPGFEGLYQVNAIVAEGTSSGLAVRLEIRIGGVAANVVQIAVE